MQLVTELGCRVNWLVATLSWEYRLISWSTSLKRWQSRWWHNVGVHNCKANIIFYDGDSWLGILMNAPMLVTHLENNKYIPRVIVTKSREIVTKHLRGHGMLETYLLQLKKFKKIILFLTKKEYSYVEVVILSWKILIALPIPGKKVICWHLWLQH